MYTTHAFSVSPRNCVFLSPFLGARPPVGVGLRVLALSSESFLVPFVVVVDDDAFVAIVVTFVRVVLLFCCFPRCVVWSMIVPQQ